MKNIDNQRFEDVVMSFFAAKNIYTQKEAADYLEITPQYMSDLICGRKKISARFCQKVADKLGIDVEEFFEDAGTAIQQNNINGNSVNGSINGSSCDAITSAELFDIIRRKDEQLAKRDEQIDRLITIIEKQ